MPNVALAIFILVESLRKDKKSFLHPYLTTLPVSYSTPVYFEVTDLEALKGSPAFGNIKNIFLIIIKNLNLFKYNIQK